MIKINLASGQRPFQKPWINIDKIKQFDGEGKQYALDYEADANDLNMFADESVDIIVAHHLVEHIAIHDLDNYIREWRRVLKPGGILAIFVPNLRDIDLAWLGLHPQGHTLNAFHHNVQTYGAYQGHIEDLHKWGYDEKELIDRIESEGSKFGWAEIRNYQPSNPLYENADIAQDWYILSKEFVK